MYEIGKVENKINIRDINSPFIKEIIFSFLTEKQKLDIIMYNNKLQNLLLVNIENYKKISGK